MLLWIVSFGWKKMPLVEKVAALCVVAALAAVVVVAVAVAASVMVAVVVAVAGVLGLWPPETGLSEQLTRYCAALQA